MIIRIESESLRALLEYAAHCSKQVDSLQANCTRLVEEKRKLQAVVTELTRVSVTRHFRATEVNTGGTSAGHAVHQKVEPAHCDNSAEVLL